MLITYVSAALKTPPGGFKTPCALSRKKVRKQTPLGFVAHNLEGDLDLWLSSKFKGGSRVKLPSVAQLYSKILFKTKVFSG